MPRPSGTAALSITPPMACGEACRAPGGRIRDEIDR